MMKKLIVIVCMLLSGCSLLSPVSNKPPHSYLLDPENIVVATAPRTSQTVLITEPASAAGYTTSDLLYTNKQYQLASFTQNRWADVPAKMLTPLMVIALQKTDHYAAIISYPYVGKTDLRIDTQLVRFQQNFLKTPSEVEMAVLVRVIEASTQRVKASKLFEINMPAEDNPYSGVIAANAATAQFLREFTEFCIRETPGHSED